MKRTIWLYLCLLFWIALPGQNIHPDSTTQLLHWIKGKTKRLDTLEMVLPEDIQLAVQLGRWDLLEKWEAQNLNNDLNWHWYKLERLLQAHQYDKAKVFFAKIESLPIPVLVRAALSPEELGTYKRHYQRCKARFAILAWNLDSAKAIYLDMLDQPNARIDALIGLGNIEILQKNYLKAEALALQVLEMDSTYAEAYKLAAEANFWMRDEALAETFIKKALAYAPLDADARFAYGYAIWRRRDASLLKKMAAQWDIALKINPHHYKTHWHWGNGHTHLTYQDYFDPNESTIRKKLAEAEKLIIDGEFEEGIQKIRLQKTAYPKSVIPDLYLGSYFYQKADENVAYLDSSEQVFLGILRQKNHFGPAHNGLAAVIKKRQIRALADYDSLEKKIKNTRLPAEAPFGSVFPDVKKYPGDRVSKMVWAQLKTTTAYLPMLARIGRTFAIPPLHEDLALAMKNSFFRGGTTFDNRQWMDIRGVGSGATGIEYVERGAHLERNVTLHEYVHLFHGVLFTEEEMREVRGHYYKAMKEGGVLDYYAANNEFEYLAQAIPAYFSEKKVHPLNHKAANTTADLLQKDSGMYAWVKQLVSKQEAYLEGDSMALAGNWAQAYLYLSNQALLERRDSLAGRYIDTALLWYPDYIPALIRQSQLARRKGDLKDAQKILISTIATRPQHPGLLAEEAMLWTEMYQEGQVSLEKAIRKASQNYQAALEYEKDLMFRAELNARARDFFKNYGLWEEGISLAEGYVLDAPEISTYLRDEKDANRLYVAYLKGKMGHYLDAGRSFEQLIEAKPQNYYYRERYGEVLLQLGRYKRLVEIIKPSQDLLKATGAPRKDFQQLLALAFLGQNDSLAFAMAMSELDRMKHGRPGDPWLDLQLKLRILGPDSTLNILEKRPISKEPLQASEYHYWRAQLLIELDRLEEAGYSLQRALQYLPYHWPARMSYVQVLQLLDREKEAQVIAREGLYLPFPPGDFYSRQLDSYFINEEKP